MNEPNADLAVAIAFAVIFALSCCVGLIMLGIHLLIHYLLYSAAAVIPKEHQKINPLLIWLLLIPVFQIVWNFVVFMQLSDSFKSYFDSRGVTDVGDCSRTLGLGYSISVVVMFAGGPVAAFLPPVLCIFTPLPLISLALLVVYLLKVMEYKRRIEAEHQVFPPVEVV